MHTLVINDKEYKMPSYISLTMWMKLMEDVNSPDHMISTVFGCTKEEAQSIPEQTKELVAAFIFSLLQPNEKSQKYLKRLIDFEKLSIGEFIDLDVYITNGIEKHMVEVIEILFNAKDVQNWNVAHVTTGLNRFMLWKNSIYFNYKNLFYSEPTDEDASPADNVAKMWYDIVMVLADGKFLNIEAVTDKTVMECFNWLAWNKEQQRKLKELTK